MTRLLLAGSAALFAAAPALAQPAPPPAPAAPQVQMQRQHMAMRVHTRDEVASHVRTLFTRLDTNRDGFVTRAEADAAKSAMGGDRRARFAERLAERGGASPDRGAAFDRIDVNRDGMITRQEFMAAKPRVEQRVMVMRDGMGGAPGQPGVPGQGGMMHMHGMGMHGRMFDMADANRDGRVTLQEMTAAALQHFDMADLNRDGRITPEERMQRRQRAHGQRQPA